MSNIDKQALRERYSEKPAPKCHICGSVMTIQRAGAGGIVYGCTGRIDKDGEGYKFAEGRDFADDHYARSRVTVTNESDPDVLALLDELEAKDSMIAAQQHEIRTLLNALEGRPCPKCNDTGMADSGGTQPWGEPISVPCDCAAPPSPVAVPEGYRLQPISEYDAMCAAMLQGADVSLTHEGKNHHEDKLGMVNHLGDVTEKVEPVTQIEPVADLYGLTSPTGSETSFTFDAVEARDFVDGGWSCQEYVELERFQEAITNHTEDKLAMVDHSGDSNNMVEPVTTANKLPFDQWLSQQTGTIDVECGCVMTEVFFHWLRVAYEAGNYPVIPDGWVLVPEEPTHEMLEAGDEQFGTYDVYRRMIAAAPQQEA